MPARNLTFPALWVHHNNPVLTVGPRDCLKSSHRKPVDGGRELVLIAASDYHH